PLRCISLARAEFSPRPRPWPSAQAKISLSLRPRVVLLAAWPRPPLREEAPPPTVSLALPAAPPICLFSACSRLPSRCVPGPSPLAVLSPPSAPSLRLCGAGLAPKMASIMEGPLSKWTNVMKGWQYRWFVLDYNAGLLSYYTSKDKMMRGSRRGCVRLRVEAPLVRSYLSKVVRIS
uniref:Oxysterol binding protein like 9 n=1 Tax=Chrysemys picta bellii TaxID=8478 RepID=A0A8C3FSG0_CHRPI